MAIEERNGNYYYYKKERDGKQVVSKYYGKGEVASLIAQMDEIERQKKERNQREEKRRREKAELFEKDLIEIETAFNKLVAAHLLINGYRQTDSREWRKKRNGKK